MTVNPVTEFKTITTTMWKDSPEPTHPTGKPDVNERPEKSEPHSTNDSHKFTLTSTHGLDNGGPVSEPTHQSGTPEPSLLQSSGTPSEALPATGAPSDALPADKAHHSSDIPLPSGSTNPKPTTAPASAPGTAIKASHSGSAAHSSGTGFTFSPITLAPESSHSGHASTLHELTAKVSGHQASASPSSSDSAASGMSVSVGTLLSMTVVGAIVNTLFQL